MILVMLVLLAWGDFVPYRTGSRASPRHATHTITGSRETPTGTFARLDQPPCAWRARMPLHLLYSLSSCDRHRCLVSFLRAVARDGPSGLTIRQGKQLQPCAGISKDLGGVVAWSLAPSAMLSPVPCTCVLRNHRIVSRPTAPPTHERVTSRGTGSRRRVGKMTSVPNMCVCAVLLCAPCLCPWLSVCHRSLICPALNHCLGSPPRPSSLPACSHMYEHWRFLVAGPFH